MELDGPCILDPVHSNVKQLEFEENHVKVKTLFGYVEYMVSSVTVSSCCVNDFVPMAELPALPRLP